MDTRAIEIKNLEETISKLESQRPLLGDSVVNIALAPLQQKLSELKQSHSVVPDAERKYVTVLFADITGFTALSEDMDPEQVRKLMNECFDVLVPCIEYYGGYIDKFIGDSVMALFGAPVAHENDAERALRAALEMMAALRDFSKKNGLEINLHIGVNSGLVVAGGIGSNGKMMYSVLGDTVNLASRFEGLSEAGEILTGESTYRLAAHLFDFDKLEPVAVKGKSEPVTIYLLKQVKNIPGTARGIRGLSSLMVGREEELAAGLSVVRHFGRENRGGTVVITGEAGIGKSRLVTEILAHTVGIDWIFCKASSFMSDAGYWLIAGIMDGLLGITGEATPDSIKVRLRETIEQYCPGSKLDLLAYLSRLRNLPLSADEELIIRDLPPDILSYRFTQALADLIKGITYNRKLGLICDDLHWADPSSIKVLAQLHKLCSDYPLLLMLILRNGEEEIDSLLNSFSDNCRYISLQALSRPQSQEMIANLVAVDRLSEEVLSSIRDKSGGNPFFIEELIRSLIDRNMAVVADGKVKATGEVNALEISDTLHGVIAARLDKLDPDLKYLLQVASVAGREIDKSILAEVLKEDSGFTNVADKLTTLIHREYLVEAGAGKIVFRHAPTVDVAYHSILKAKRRKLHNLLGTVIERSLTEVPDDMMPLVANHFVNAGNFNKGMYYLELLTEKAISTFSNAEAKNFISRSLQMLEEEHKKEPNEVQKSKLLVRMLELQEKKADILSITGFGNQSISIYLEIAGSYQLSDTIHLARISRKTGEAYNVLRRVPDALRCFFEANGILNAIGNNANMSWRDEWIQLQLDFLWTYYLSGKLENVGEVLATASDTIEQHGNPAQKARYYQSLVFTDLLKYRYFNLPLSTLENQFLACKYAEWSKNKKTIMQANAMLGFVYLWRDDFDNSERLFAAAIEEGKQTGQMETYIIAVTYLSHLMRRTMHTAELIPLAKDGISVAKETGQVMYLALLKGNLASALISAGLPDEAWSELHEADQIAGTLPIKLPVYYFIAGPLARLYASKNDFAAVVGSLRKISEGHKEWPRDIYSMMSEVEQAYNHGDIARAARLFDELVAYSSEYRLGIF